MTTVLATNPGKTTLRVATVEITLDHLLDDRPEEPILLLEPVLILLEESIEVVEEYSVEDSAFRMTLTIDP